MSELTTKTAADVFSEVKRLFGDEDGVQITGDDALKWINAAQRKIVSTSPILQRSVVHDIEEGVKSYAFPLDKVQYIAALSYKGVPLQHYSYSEAQEYILRQGGIDYSTEKPLIWYEWAQNIILWPTPKTGEVGALTLDFVANPTDCLLMTDTLSVPDRYFDVMVDAVMLKANVLEQDWNAVNYSRSAMMEGLDQLSEQENKIQLAYPSITVRDEDRW